MATQRHSGTISKRRKRGLACVLDHGLPPASGPRQNGTNTAPSLTAQALQEGQGCRERPFPSKTVKFSVLAGLGAAWSRSLPECPSAGVETFLSVSVAALGIHSVDIWSGYPLGAKRLETLRRCVRRPSLAADLGCGACFSSFAIPCRTCSTPFPKPSGRARAFSPLPAQRLLQNILRLHQRGLLGRDGPLLQGQVPRHVDLSGLPPWAARPYPCGAGRRRRGHALRQRRDSPVVPSPLCREKCLECGL